MNVQTLIAIAQLCHYSIAPGAVGDLYARFEPYNNLTTQLTCQKYLISCVRSEKDKKKRQSDTLADCISNMDWK